MSNWEHELETLLSRLGVHWEPSPAHAPEAEADEAEVPGPEELAALLDDDLEDEDWEHLAEEEVDQLGVVRREMQATVGRVARMVRAGRLDSVIRDDVLFVLRALCRVQPLLEGESDEDAQLATAAAILHFCRIVLRLTHALAQQ
jgi:hypothetical protein